MKKSLLLLALCILYSSPVAANTPTRTLQATGRTGYFLYDRGEFKTASLIFTNMRSHVEDQHLVVILAFCHENMKNNKEAISLFNTYLSLAPTDAEDRGKIEAKIVELSRIEITIKSEPVGVHVSMEGPEIKDLGITPLTISLDKPGRYTLHGYIEGYKSFKEVIDVTVGDRITLKWALSDIWVDPKSDSSPLLSISGWTLAGAGAISIGLGVYFMLKSNSNSNDITACWDGRDSLCEGPDCGCNLGQYDSHREDERRYGDLGNGFLWGGVGVLAVGATLLIMDVMWSTETVRVAPQVTSNEVGLGVWVVF